MAAGSVPYIVSYEDVTKVEVHPHGDECDLILSMGRRKRVRLEVHWSPWESLPALVALWGASPHMSSLFQEDEARQKGLSLEEDDPGARAMEATCSTSEVMCIYRTGEIGARGGVAVSWKDYCLLNPEEYLNDTLIDFWVKFVAHSDVVLQPAQQERCLFLSSFFWKLLCREVSAEHQRNGAEQSYEAVFKWLRGKDLFSKDFVFIPICERLHWTLAVLCFPRHIGLPKESVPGKHASIIYLDSFGRTKPQAFAKLRKCLAFLWNRNHPDDPASVIDTVPG